MQDPHLTFKNKWVPYFYVFYGFHYPLMFNLGYLPADITNFVYFILLHRGHGKRIVTYFITKVLHFVRLLTGKEPFIF